MTTPNVAENKKGTLVKKEQHYSIQHGPYFFPLNTNHGEGTR